MLKKLNNKKGFTLMEMLIVVAIIAVLVAIAIPVFNGALTKSKEAADVANVRALYAEWQVSILTENKDIPADKAAFLAGPDKNGATEFTFNYADGEKRYIIAPKKLSVGDVIVSGETADIKVGNALPIMNIPVGTMIHNIELRPGKGGELARSAGASAQILGREGNYVMVRLSSGEQRLILGTCYATIGEVGNEDQSLVRLGKAGRSRHLGIRPTVRGSVMNPNDHPHGGGEGRAPIGRKGPVTPWGKPALGYKTRKNKASDKFIVRRRNSK